MQIVARSDAYAVTVFPAVDVAGCEHLVLVAKATWKLPALGQRLKPIAPQPLFDADECYGEPGTSALRYANDLARFKPFCDVLFDANAYAPKGKPTKNVEVKAQIGAWSKRIWVIGDRHWKRSFLSYALSAPEPFIRMPLHMGKAFGGTRYPARMPETVEAYDLNPVGVGWAGKYSSDDMHGAALPNLEPIHKALSAPTENFEPIALNAIGCNTPQRTRFAGTYDDAWRRDVFPFLPADFDDRYFQAASADQQIPYPKGGEVVELINMVPQQPRLTFKLPDLSRMQMRVLRKNYEIELPPAHADTVFIEPDAMRLNVVWRSQVRIHRSINEFHTIAVGPIDEHWWEQLSMGIDDAECTGCTSTAPRL